MGITLPEHSPPEKEPRVEYQRELELTARGIRDCWDESRDQSRAAGRYLAWLMRRLNLHLHNYRGLVCELVDDDYFELRMAGEVRRYRQPTPKAERGQLSPHYIQLVLVIQGLYLRWDEAGWTARRMVGEHLAYLLHQSGLNTVTCGVGDRALQVRLLGRPGWFKLQRGNEIWYYREEE